MLTFGFPAAAFATNCYVLAAGPGQECVIVDPGIGVLPRLQELLGAHRLRPAAVVLTHGHLDHVYSVTPVCGASGVAAYVHGDDRYRLRNPLDLIEPELLGMLEAQFGESARWREPDDVVELADGAALSIAGVGLEVLHAPGHTEGSIMLRVEDVPDGIGPDSALARTILTGDVIFAGSIGRTDLAGGSMAAMTNSLRTVVLPLPDDSLLLPGHGPATTMARERATNPYLTDLGV